MLAQKKKKKLQLGGLFDSLKIDVKQYKDIIESFKGLDFSKSGQMFIVTNEENKREIYKVKFLYLYLGTNKISDNFTPLKSISSN